MPRKSPAYIVISTAENSAIILGRGGIIRRFWAPSEGGYVRRVSDSHPGTLGQQVCQRLERSGSTLSWTPSAGPLVDLIRREAKLAVQWGKRNSYTPEQMLGLDE